MRTLIVCCLSSVLLLTLYLREPETGPVHLVRAGISWVATPVRLIGAGIARPFGMVGTAFTNLTASEATLTELKRENAELTAKLAELGEAEATAERLEALVGISSTYKLKTRAARVVGATSDAWTHTLTIDKGSSAGLAIGMPVLSAGGVAGQIVELAPQTATVRLITDERSGISAMVQSSRAQGTLRGQADGGLRLDYVPADMDVKAGDIVITSGLGGVFPKGLPLGTVASVEKDGSQAYRTIIVRSPASARANEEVLIVTEIGQDQVASVDEVRAANGSGATTPDQKGDA
ncbi:rod shape-determining protein MreC [Collinsella sp. AGMB00827]|uniref:Cell shape-determining protein MreC n=1 Tax=Collinsella ureilytica TaxID=2869515 RepID=A0ABS7ML25_9ACTN|nr:rod shape-determining protein MreC [Collinsella urealyticum]MBY4798069.1 rod shape-determining protein MreC [Collinsella urealyticum]